MIRVTRLNNKAFIVNSDLIEFIEQAPDTVLSLSTGEKIVVRETDDEVIRRIIDFRRSIVRECSICPCDARDRESMHVDQTGQRRDARG